MNQETRAMTHASEWGIRALQSSFPCLKGRMIHEETDKQNNIMTTMILFFYLHSQQVGINQILKTHMPQSEGLIFSSID